MKNLFNLKRILLVCCMILLAVFVFSINSNNVTNQQKNNSVAYAESTDVAYLYSDYVTLLNEANGNINVNNISSIKFTNVLPEGEYLCGVGSTTPFMYSYVESNPKYVETEGISNVYAYVNVNAQDESLFDVVFYAPCTIYTPSIFVIKGNALSFFDFGNANTYYTREFHVHGTKSLKSFDVSTIDSTNIKILRFYNNELLESINFGDNEFSLTTLEFKSCYSLKQLDLTTIDTSNMTGMRGMFWLCKSLESVDLSSFDTSNVCSMELMFDNCISLKSLNLSNFNTSKVINMADMFAACVNLTELNLSNFDTSSVTDMSHMFADCRSLTELNLSNFNTSSATNMSFMFSNCLSLTSLNLSNFDTSSATNMSYMFRQCLSLTSLDLSTFDTSSVTDMSSMFSSCSSLTTLNISNFDTSSVTDMWSMFSYCSSLTSLDLSKFDTSSVTDVSGMFYHCESLTSLNISNFDTSSVTDMSGVFECCYKLKSINLTNFNTEKVTDMSSMFSGCSLLEELDITNFDTSNVTDMSYMFGDVSDGCKTLRQIKGIDTFDTSSVTNMSYMFSLCSSLTSLNLSNFDTSNVTDMSNMFEYCKKLKTLNLSNFDTSNVTDMSNMFNWCDSLAELDLSSFDCSKVTNFFQFVEGSKLRYFILPYNVPEDYPFEMDNYNELAFYDTLEALPNEFITSSNCSTENKLRILVRRYTIRHFVRFNNYGEYHQRYDFIQYYHYNIDDDTVINLSVDGRYNLIETWSINKMPDYGKATLNENQLFIDKESYGHIELKLAIKAKTFTITLDPNGGTIVDEIDSLTYSNIHDSSSNTRKNLPIVKKSNAILDTWEITVNTNGAESFIQGTSQLAIPSRAYGDITVTAKWRYIEYNISLSETNNSLPYSNIKYISSDDVEQTITLDGISRNGYTFKNWIIKSNSKGKESSINGNNLIIPAEAYGSISIYADWDKITYNIIYDTQGGSEIIASMFSYQIGNYVQNIYIYETPTKAGHTFNCWQIEYGSADIISSDTICIPINSIGDIKLKAIWEKITYYITYDLQGGSTISNNYYLCNDYEQTITIDSTTKNGYELVGWQILQNTEGGLATLSNNIISIPANAYGDIRLQAVWELITSNEDDNNNNNNNNGSNNDKISNSSILVIGGIAGGLILLIITVVIVRKRRDY